MDFATGRVSCLDLTLASRSLAGRCRWGVMEESTVGSDHFPVWCEVGGINGAGEVEALGRWNFGKARWGEFQVLSEEGLRKVDLGQGVEELCGQVTSTIVGVAEQTIGKKVGRGRRKGVPWWSEECDRVVKDRNRAFRALRANQAFSLLVE